MHHLESYDPRSSVGLRINGFYYRTTELEWIHCNISNRMLIDENATIYPMQRHVYGRRNGKAIFAEEHIQAIWYAENDGRKPIHCQVLESPTYIRS